MGKTTHEGAVAKTGQPASGMEYRAYLKALTAAAARWKGQYAVTTFGRARGVARPVPLVHVSNVRMRKGGLLLMAGFHGEEPAGPLALLHYLHHILGRALDLKVPLAIFPVVNPNGFDHCVRTTVAGEYTNAGFAHDEDVPARETLLLRAEMERFAPAVFLDLHEDDHETRTYLYSFGDPALAGRLVEALDTFIPIAQGPLTHTPSLQVVDGQLRDHHDGSAEDFMSHSCTAASFASETPTKAPLVVRMAADLALIDICLEYVAEQRAGRGAKRRPKAR